VESIKNYNCLNPVVIVVFNRPEKTKLLLEALRLVAPTKLYVICDGPRKNHELDKTNVTLVRKIVDDELTWDCEVTKIYSEINLRGPKRVPSGLDIVFEKEEQAIILEDDCIPTTQFFQFIDELLNRYKDDSRIGTVCGFNPEFDFWGNPIEIKRNASYLFSRIPATWGWATWRRVWKNFDRNMTDFPELVQNKQFNTISNISSVRSFFVQKYTLFYQGKQDHWDYRLMYSLFLQNQLSIIPNVSLVSNIGADGTGQNMGKKDYLSLKKGETLTMPLIHPSVFMPNYKYEQRITRHFFTNNKLYKGIRKLRNIFLGK
jgi:hypothetical protein